GEEYLDKHIAFNLFGFALLSINWFGHRQNFDGPGVRRRSRVLYFRSNRRLHVKSTLLDCPVTSATGTAGSNAVSESSAGHHAAGSLGTAGAVAVSGANGHIPGTDL